MALKVRFGNSLTASKVNLIILSLILDEGMDLDGLDVSSMSLNESGAEESENAEGAVGANQAIGAGCASESGEASGAGGVSGVGGVSINNLDELELFINNSGAGGCGDVKGQIGAGGSEGDKGLKDSERCFTGQFRIQRMRRSRPVIM